MPVLQTLPLKALSMLQKGYHAHEYWDRSRRQSTYMHGQTRARFWHALGKEICAQTKKISRDQRCMDKSDEPVYKDLSDPLYLVLHQINVSSYAGSQLQAPSSHCSPACCSSRRKRSSAPGIVLFLKQSQLLKL